MGRVPRKNMKDSSFFHIMVQGLNKEYIFNTKKNMEKWTKEIFKNEEYQKLAIEVVEDGGFYSLRGTVTCKLLLVMADKVSKKILDKLLYNILYSYQDKEEKIPLLFIGEKFDISYAKIIICNPEIKLKKEYQKRMFELLVSLAKKTAQYDFDERLFTSYLLCKNINKEDKVKMVEVLEEEQLMAIKNEIVSFYTHWYSSLFPELGNLSEDDIIALIAGENADGIVKEIFELIFDKIE